MSDTIGFIGLGTMGAPMCRNLVKAGFEPIVYDVEREATHSLVEVGAVLGKNPADVAQRSNVIFTMLPTTSDVEAVIIGEGGLIFNAVQGSLVVDTSTISPLASKKVKAALSGCKINFMDAAVGRTPMHAAEGKCMFMVGGAEPDLERVRPALEAMGDTIYHCGPVGSGVQTKLINNYLTTTQAAITSEALTLAQKANLDLDQTLKILSDTMASNALLSFYFRKKVLSGDMEPGFSIELASKDLRLALQTGKSHELTMKTGVAALELYELAAKKGCGQYDFSYLVETSCKEAKVDAPRIKQDKN